MLWLVLGLVLVVGWLKIGISFVSFFVFGYYMFVRLVLCCWLFFLLFGGMVLFALDLVV